MKRATANPAAAGLLLLLAAGAAPPLRAASPVRSPAGPSAGVPGVDEKDLIQRLQARLESDRDAIRRYSYVESAVLEKRTPDGSLRSSTTEVYEITYREGRRVKRRLADDLAQDSDGFALMRREESRFASPGAGGAAAGRLRGAKEGPLDVDRLVGCFRLYPLGRDRVADTPTIKVAFTSIDGCLADDSRAARILNGLAGTLWVDEGSFDLVRVRGYLKQPVTFGFGLLGKVDAFDLELDREPLEPGLYAVTRIAYRAHGTSFLFHRFDVRSTRQRSGFARIGDLPAPPEPLPNAQLAPGGGVPRAPR